MDSNVFSVLLAVVIGLFVFLAEKASKGKKKGNDAGQPQRPAGTPARISMPRVQAAVSESERHEALRRRREKAAVQEVRQVSQVQERPMRKVEEPKRTQDPEVPRPAAGVSPATLRNAFIWSEILKTKF